MSVDGLDEKARRALARGIEPGDTEIGHEQLLPHCGELSGRQPVAEDQDRRRAGHWLHGGIAPGGQCPGRDEHWITAGPQISDSHFRLVRIGAAGLFNEPVEPPGQDLVRVEPGKIALDHAVDVAPVRVEQKNVVETEA